MKRRKKIGIALGGGAARGIAHLGVLEILEKNNIPVDIITGTSMGAIIGGMYAGHPEIQTVKKTVRDFFGGELFTKAKFDFLNKKDTVEGEGFFFKFSSFIRRNVFYSLSMAKRSFISEETIRETFAHILDDTDIEKLARKYAAVSLDLKSGREYVFDKGSLRTAVEASCAIPGIMSPVKYDGCLLVDGGWIESVPVQTARKLGADVVIGVDIRGDLTEKDSMSSGLDIVFRADKVSRYALSEEKLKGADLIITPEVGDIHWADFSRIEHIMELGRKETLESIDAIKKLTSSRNEGIFRKLFRF